MADGEITYRDERSQDLWPADADRNNRVFDSRLGYGWQDLTVQVRVDLGAPTAPDLANWRGTMDGYSFPHGEMAQCHADFHLDHRYNPDGGSVVYPGMVYPHVHFSPNTTSTGVVRFGCAYTMAQRGDAPTAQPYPVEQTLYWEYAITENRQYWHLVSESAEGYGITQSGILQVDALIKCRFFRDGGHPDDTFPDPVFIDTVDIHFPTTRMIATPLRRPPFYNEA